MKTTFKSIFTASAVLVLTIVMFAFYGIQQQAAGKAWDVPAKYKSMKNPIPGKDVEVGKGLWAKHCKSCHGAAGLGDGPKSKMLKTNCGDFSTAKFQGQSDGIIYYQSFVGRDEMPNFEKKITVEDDRWALINFIRTLKK